MHKYIEDVEYRGDVRQSGSLSYEDIEAHAVFYAVCQAVMYIMCFRHADMLTDRKRHAKCQMLKLDRIVASQLNPLKVVLPSVVKEFATITRIYQVHIHKKLRVHVYAFAILRAKEN